MNTDLKMTIMPEVTKQKYHMIACFIEANHPLSNDYRFPRSERKCRENVVKAVDILSNETATIMEASV
jgi:hypothetical protein